MRILLYTVVCLSLFSSSAFSHGGDNPVKDLQKNQSRLYTKQKSFTKLTSNIERIESLQKQVGYLQSNIFILRKLMAKDYPHVKEGMSKYKLDYMKELDDSLKAFKKTIKLMESTVAD